MIQKVMVAGATGRTGKRIIERILQTGVTPHVLVRDLPAAQALWRNTVLYHPGDVREHQTLLPAMEGMQAVISAIGTQTPVGKNCPKRVDFGGVANLIQAALANQVKRFILVSSIAVTHPEHPLNHFGKILEWKLKGEEILRQSGLEYAIIRPGGLTDTPGGRRQLIYGQGDHLLGTISRSDLAEICLHALQYPHPIKVTFEVVQADDQVNTKWQPSFISSKIQ